ncbi:MAG: sulfate adenylyltransferase subunit CysD [Candidatus Gastranaerophilales bacterium]|nr:sulfate adenylyltransferase subunit CysD [Candidatus Gastranaerophilales bacterium]
MDNYLKNLEYQAIDIIRDTVFNNDVEKIVAFYSIGKDSSVLLHLFKKAFYPNKIPIKFLHIDTGWKFPEMYEFREKIANEIDLLIFKHPACLNPYKDGRNYTDIMKTQALKMSQEHFGFKIAFGGARRDEEKSRAKERIISIRDKNGYWNARKQNPEISPLYNPFYCNDTSLRVFPLSNWTELDIWKYIKEENIEIVPIYFSHKRKVKITTQNNKELLLIPQKGEKTEELNVRFRTLGCYPLTGAVRSNAKNIDEIIKELEEVQYSERITRVIDYDAKGSMEIKKQEGYF